MIFLSLSIIYFAIRIHVFFRQEGVMHKFEGIDAFPGLATIGLALLMLGFKIELISLGLWMLSLAGLTWSTSYFVELYLIGIDAECKKSFKAKCFKIFTEIGIVVVCSIIIYIYVR